MLKVHRNICIAVGDKAQACRSVVCLEGTSVHLIPSSAPSAELQGGVFRPIPLPAIEAFCEELSQSIQKETNNAVFVVYTGSANTVALMHACLLVGAYMMLKEEMELDTILLAFHSVEADIINPQTASSNDPHAICVLDCWSALAAALHLGWLVGPSSDADPLLDAEECSHYAHPANGNVHMLAPGSLYLFATPDAMPDRLAWTDIAPAEVGGASGRRFSVGFTADPLVDLGASAVACLDVCPAASAAAFAARGMAVADLVAGRGQPSLLRALDGLLSAADGAARAGGALAVHSGAGFEWPTWAGTLATAFLVRRHGFRAAAAAGWVHMLCPWLVSPGAAE